MNTPTSSVISLSLWDLPGREPLDMRRSYYRDLDAAIVVVDLTDQSSIEMAGTWKQEVLNQVTMTTKQTTAKPHVISDVISDVDDANTRKNVDIPILLLGTKYDQIQQNVITEVPSQQDILDGQLQGKRPPKIHHHLEKPECVRLMESVCSDHHFLASAAVSSQLNDGSVDSAIDSLVRYLICQVKPSTQDSSQSCAVESETDTDLGPMLMRINIPQFDTIFDKCDELVRFCSKLRCCLEYSFKKLVDVCYGLNVISSKDGSLEQCVIGIKGLTPDGYELQMTEDENFCQLTLKINDSSQKVKNTLKQVIKCFNTEYAEISKTIIRHSHSLIEKFTEYDAEIAKLCDSIDVRHYVRNKKLMDSEVKRLQKQVEHNRGLMDHKKTQYVELVGQVRYNVDKVANALMW